MKVVVDTNVLVSATLIRGGNEDRILRAWRQGLFDLVFSPATLDELQRVLTYEKLRKKRWLSQEEVVRLIEALAAESILVPGKLEVRSSRDPDDDKFIAVALEAKAQYVVSGDRDLLELNGFRGLTVVRPTAFLAVLEERSQG